MKRIKFQGEEYLFDGDSLDEEGFIAKREDYENGICSYAHYFPDQGVMRFREQIGTREDIEILGDGEANVNLEEAFYNLLNPASGGWSL